MMLTGILTVAAFLLIGLGSSPRERKPLLTAGGIVLLVASIILHLTGDQSAMRFLTTFAAELGVGLWVLAGMMARSDRSGRPFFALGAASLTVAVVLIATGKIMSVVGAETILVELGPDDHIEEIQPILAGHEASAERAYPSVSMSEDEDLAQIYLVSVPSDRREALLSALASDSENVDHVEVNRLLNMIHPVESGQPVRTSGQVMENDPLVSSQWALDAIQAHEAHAILEPLTPERRAVVAILDTGVDGNHEDLEGSFGSSPANRDQNGHGSHCAGIAGAVTNNGVGVASLNWEGRFVEVAGYAALNERGFGTVEMIAQAIVDATRDGVDVISMSLGDRAPAAPKSIRDAVEYALANDVIVVASAGNANEDAADHMPSNIEGIIVVSAVDENLQKASFSNTNTSLQRPITAPGVDILSLKTTGGYVTMSGTSMSTPVVSGLLGVMRSLDPDLSDDEAYQILLGTARDVQDTDRIGRLINSEAAISSVLERRSRS